MDDGDGPDRDEPDGGVEHGPTGGRLLRYVVSATLARAADSGAGVGLVLLATHPTSGVRHGATVGGLLAAALSAPHLLGPWVGRFLDRARDPRFVLAVAFTVYAAALSSAALLLGRASIAFVVGAVVLAGVCGPLLTGGLSSRLDGLAGPGERQQRRAQGWDAASYGLGGTAGPALVSGLAVLAGPRTALVALAGLPAAAALAVLTVRASARRAEEVSATLTVAQTLRAIATDGRLRRVAVATMMTAITLGAMSVFSVLLGQALSDRTGAGAALGAAFGIGNLAGSLLVTAFPLRGEPERLTVRHVALMAVAFGLCTVAPNYPLALAAFALAGASNAPFFTATLAARSQYAPPGARAQVFVSVAGLKVASSSAGTAVAGLCAFLGPRPLMAGCVAMTLLAAGIATVDRRLSRRHPPDGASSIPSIGPSSEASSAPVPAAVRGNGSHREP